MLDYIATRRFNMIDALALILAAQLFTSHGVIAWAVMLTVGIFVGFMAESWNEAVKRNAALDR